MSGMKSLCKYILPQCYAQANIFKSSGFKTIKHRLLTCNTLDIGHSNKNRLDFNLVYNIGCKKNR